MNPDKQTFFMRSGSCEVQEPFFTFHKTAYFQGFLWVDMVMRWRKWLGSEQ